VSISGALSISFIVVAFQQERIFSWLKNVPWDQVLIWIGALAVFVLPIALIWTRPLASSVETAVTIALVLVAATCGIGFIIYRVVTAIRDTGATGSSYSGSLVDD